MDQLRHSKALEELLANCSQNGPQVNQNWTKKTWTPVRRRSRSGEVFRCKQFIDFCVVNCQLSMRGRVTYMSMSPSVGPFPADHD